MSKNTKKPLNEKAPDTQTLADKIKDFKPQDGHRMPITRRELLAAGLIQGAAAMAFPTLAGLLSSQTAKAAGATLAPAYFEVWASGGAMFPSNVAVTDVGRNLLKDYSSSGQGNGSNVVATLADGVTPNFANRIPMFSNSGFYKALNSIPNMASVLAKTYFVTIPADLLSDSAGNIMSAQGLVQSAISAGMYLPYLQSGDVFNPSAYTNPPAPLSFTSFDSLLDAVSARSGDTFANLPTGARASLSKFVKKMNANQASRFNTRPGGASLATALSAATDKVYQLTSGAINTSAFDPRNDPSMSSIWNLAGKPNSSSEVVEAAVAYNVAKGNACTGSIARGGYDYHGADRGATAASDQSVFELTLRLLKTLDYAQRPGVIQLTTDGSCYGSGMNSPFPGDSNNICCTHLMIYSPTPINFATLSGGRLENQIGQFTAGGIADQAPATSAARGTAVAAFMNYMSLAGLSSKAPNLVTGAGLSPAQLAEITLVKS